MTFRGHTPPSYPRSTGVTAACLEEVRGSFKEGRVWKRNGSKSCHQQARLPIGSGHLNSWHHTPTEIAFTHWVPAVSSQKICLGLYCGEIELVSIFIKAWATNPRHTSVALPHSNTDRVGNEIRKKKKKNNAYSKFTKIKYLGISIRKEGSEILWHQRTKSRSHRRWEGLPWPWIGRINVFKREGEEREKGCRTVQSPWNLQGCSFQR